MKLNKLYLLILPLLMSFVQKEEIVVSADEKQDFYRTIETDAEGWTWNGFEAFENVEASKSWEHGTFEKNNTGTYRFKGTDINILGYKNGVHVKDIPILEALGYIFVPILSHLYLNEKIDKRTIISIITIITGIIIFYL